MTTLGQMGEHEIIRRLIPLLGNAPGLILGAGDDCALVRLPDGKNDQVLTTDPVVEGVHFRAGDNAERVGNKAAGRVLSDIAAMGAQPQWLLVNIVAPPQLDYSYLEGIYSGMSALCNRFGATIIGGDLAQGPHLGIHVFGTGLLPAGTALLRSGAKAGDRICVTGALGGSGRGRHLDFIPRVEEGVFLRECGVVGAMLDVSDGLATDIRHVMAQSGVGALLQAEQIPKTGTLEQALYDGEDFELLFTVRPEGLCGLLEDWRGRFSDPPACIGSITDRVGVLELIGSDGSTRSLEDKAFEHFSR